MCVCRGGGGRGEAWVDKDYGWALLPYRRGRVDGRVAAFLKRAVGALCFRTTKPIVLGGRGGVVKGEPASPPFIPLLRCCDWWLVTRKIDRIGGGCWWREGVEARLAC